VAATEGQKREPAQVVDIVKGLEQRRLGQNPEQNGKARERCADAQRLGRKDAPRAKERGQVPPVQKIDHEREGNDDEAERGQYRQHSAGAAARIDFAGQSGPVLWRDQLGKQGEVAIAEHQIAGGNKAQAQGKAPKLTAWARWVCERVLGLITHWAGLAPNAHAAKPKAARSAYFCQDVAAVLRLPWP